MRVLVEVGHARLQHTRCCDNMEGSVVLPTPAMQASGRHVQARPGRQAAQRCHRPHLRAGAEAVAKVDRHQSPCGALQGKAWHSGKGGGAKTGRRVGAGARGSSRPSQQCAHAARLLTRSHCHPPPAPGLPSPTRRRSRLWPCRAPHRTAPAPAAGSWRCGGRRLLPRSQRRSRP